MYRSTTRLELHLRETGGTDIEVYTYDRRNLGVRGGSERRNKERTDSDPPTHSTASPRPHEDASGDHHPDPDRQRSERGRPRDSVPHSHCRSTRSPPLSPKLSGGPIGRRPPVCTFPLRCVRGHYVPSPQSALNHLSSRTVTTGTSAVRIVRSVILPKRNCSTSPRPCVPITMRSISWSAAYR